MQNSLFTGTGHVNDTGVLLYSDGLKLNKREELPEPLLAHVSECQACREEIFEYFEFAKDDEVSLPHPYFDRGGKSFSINWRYMAIAATITLLLLSAAVLYLNRNSEQVISDVNIVNKDSLQQVVPPIETELIANADTADNKQSVPEDADSQKPKPDLIAYVNIPSLDEQIARVGSSRGISVQKPEIDNEFRDKVLFQWNPAVQDTLELRLFTSGNLNNPKVIKIPPNLSSFELSSKLKPGLYYWKIRQLNGRRKRQIGLGRFRVVQ